VANEPIREPHTDLHINYRAQLAIPEKYRKCNLGAKIVFTSTRQRGLQSACRGFILVNGG
jgi:hypothetical protein